MSIYQSNQEKGSEAIQRTQAANKEQHCIIVNGVASEKKPVAIKANSTEDEISENQKVEAILPLEKKNTEVSRNNSLSQTKAAAVSQIRRHEEILGALLEELKPIDFREAAKLAEGEKLVKKHYQVATVDEILRVAKERNWGLCISNGFMYCYNGAFWKLLTEEEIRNFLGRAALKLGVGKFDAEYYQFKNELFSQFLSAAILPRPKKAENEVRINLLNGTFVITPEEQRMKDFDKDDFLTYQLPFSFSSGTTAPLFQQYLNRVLPDESQQKILSEYIGYLFIKTKALKLEKALILYGSGANGKSVFFEVITSLLGPENVCNYSLQSLTDVTGYFRAQLQNKLCNYASEISPHMNVDNFKKMVSGEPIEARLPYRDPMTITDYAKFIFNTNTLPKDVEQSDAFFRRFLIVHFGVTIPEKEMDRQLANKIITSELPGVFNWVLEGLHRLLEQQAFTHSDAVNATIKQYRMDSDSVQLFLEDLSYRTSLSNVMLLKDMFREYNEYCRESNYRPVSNRTFGERLRGQGYLTGRSNKGTKILAEKIMLS